MAMEGRWEGKGVAVFYLELTLDMLHLLVYAAFFAVVFSTYGIPLHLVRRIPSAAPPARPPQHPPACTPCTLSPEAGPPKGAQLMRPFIPPPPPGC